jgi:hypothetical protein
MSSEDRESQERLASTVTDMRKKAGLAEKAEVGKNGRVVVAGRKPSVSTGDKRERR